MDYINQIVVGDCLEVMQNLPDGCVDLVLTDPPYGITACAWDSVIPFEPMWEQLKRVTKKNSAIVLFGSQPFTSALVMSNPRMFKYEWVWVKDKGTGFAFSNKQPLRKTENISVFYQEQPFYDSQGEKLKKPYTHTLPISKSDSSKGAGEHNLESDGSRKYATYTHAKKTNLIYFARESQTKSFHPTQKPVALMEYLIKTYTNEGDLVLDFAMGSGTTAVAADRLRRKFFGCDISEEYVEMSLKRLAEDRQRRAQLEMGL